MSNPFIIFDLDDTLNDFHLKAISILNEEHGKSYIAEDLKTKTVEELYEIERQELFNFSERTRMFEKLEPLNTVKETLTYIKKLEYNILIVTARGWMEDAKARTTEWFKTHNIPFDDIFITELHESKAQKVSEVYNENFLFVVDDNVKQCFQYEYKGHRVFLKNQPWNKNIRLSSSKIKRIEALQELRFHI